MLLTAHTTGLDGTDLRAALQEAFGADRPTEVGRLGLDAETGARLDLGWAVRMG